MCCLELRRLKLLPIFARERSFIFSSASTLLRAATFLQFFVLLKRFIMPYIREFYNFRSTSSFLNYVMSVTNSTANSAASFADTKVFVAYGAARFELPAASNVEFRNRFRNSEKPVTLSAVWQEPVSSVDGLHFLRHNIIPGQSNKEILDILTSMPPEYLEAVRAASRGVGDMDFFKDLFNTVPRVVDPGPRFPKTRPRSEEHCYVMNEDLTEIGFSYNLDYIVSFLENHISESKLGTKLAGINYSMSYMSSILSCSSLHCEDSLLASVNICQGHLVPGFDQVVAKAWLIIQDPDELRKVLNELVSANESAVHFLQAVVDRQRCKANKTRYKPIRVCGELMDHKDLYLTTRFLDRHKISYKIILQRPGDVIFLAPGAPHAVMNTFPSHAVAVNLGPGAWRIGNSFVRFCQCGRCPLTVLLNECNFVSRVIIRYLRVHHCPFCKFRSFNKVVTARHFALTHRNATGFSTELAKLDTRKTARHCQVCNISVKSHNFRDHTQSAAHTNLANLSQGGNPSVASPVVRTCKFCAVGLSMLAAMEHRFSCPRNPNKCLNCHRLFSSKASLNQHHTTCNGSSSGSSFRCDKCGKDFGVGYRKSNFDRHYRSCTGPRGIYKCGKCEKTFNDRSNCYRHRKSCHGLECHAD